MSSTTSLSLSPTFVGPVSTAMPLPFWDSYHKFLLLLLDAAFPDWTPTEKLNQALKDLQLLACGPSAEMSLAAWRKARGDFAEKKDVGRGRRFWRSSKRKARLSKVFDF